MMGGRGRARLVRAPMSDEPVSPNASGKVSCPHCGEAHPVAWSHCPSTGQPIGTGKALVGRLIADRYRIVGLLAEGGMGTVYVAEHVLVGRRVAIKRLHPELARDGSNVERFQREARAAAAIGHENIVEIIDMGFAEDDAPYLAMEYLTGETLAAALRREGRLAPSRACYVLGQVLSALEAVHAAGIVHRDLKPDNIFLTRRNGRADFVKVLDFGVSKIRTENGGDASPLTRTGVMVGTPHYISPEQARGSRNHDHRVDIYATGVMLYETLTGRLPFDGHNYHALLQAILAGAPPPILSIVPSVPAGVVAVAEKAMARAASERFASAAEMHKALLAFGAVRAELDDGFGDRPTLEGADTSRMRVAPPAAARASELPPARHVARARESTSAPALHRRAASRPPAQRAADPAETPLGATIAVVSAPRAVAVLTEVSVPIPRIFPATPRPFEAKSADWVEPPADSPVRPSAAGAVVTAATARIAVVHPSTDEAPLEAPRVVGALVGMALYHLRESFGIAGVERVLSATSAESAYRLRGALITVPWVPATLIVDLAKAAESTFGDGSGAIPVEMGKGVAARALGTSHRHLVQGLSPAAAVQKVPKIWRAFHDGGDVLVGRTPSGAYNVQVGGHAPHALAHAQFMMGFFLGMLEIVGARDARAEILACIELGTARTVTELRFR